MTEENYEPQTLAEIELNETKDRVRDLEREIEHLLADNARLWKNYLKQQEFYEEEKEKWKTIVRELNLEIMKHYDGTYKINRIK